VDATEETGKMNAVVSNTGCCGDKNISEAKSKNNLSDRRCNPTIPCDMKNGDIIQILPVIKGHKFFQVNQNTQNGRWYLSSHLNANNEKQLRGRKKYLDESDMERKTITKVTTPSILKAFETENKSVDSRFVTSAYDSDQGSDSSEQSYMPNSEVESVSGSGSVSGFESDVGYVTDSSSSSSSSSAQHQKATGYVSDSKSSVSSFSSGMESSVAASIAETEAAGYVSDASVSKASVSSLSSGIVSDATTEEEIIYDIEKSLRDSPVEDVTASESEVITDRFGRVIESGTMFSYEIEGVQRTFMFFEEERTADGSLLTSDGTNTFIEDMTSVEELVAQGLPQNLIDDIMVKKSTEKLSIHVSRVKVI
jgi:hypothetical protein